MRPETESFDLALLGGVTERRYRQMRPDVEALPWGTLDLAGCTDAELAFARRLWTDLCLQEYSAAARQGEVLRLLVRARVPLDLSAVFTAFPLDELAHAEICARMATELGGPVALEYPREAVFPPPDATASAPLLAAARAVVWDFCVAETLSHGVLVSHATHAAQPLAAAAWGRLARDEAVHMQFGWTFLDWALPELAAPDRAALATTARGALAAAASLDAKVRDLPPEAFASVSVFGAQGREAYLDLCATVLRDRVLPRLRALGIGPA